jgi:hypothetical protein
MQRVKRQALLLAFVWLGMLMVTSLFHHACHPGDTAGEKVPCIVCLLHSEPVTSTMEASAAVVLLSLFTTVLLLPVSDIALPAQDGFLFARIPRAPPLG